LGDNRDVSNINNLLSGVLPAVEERRAAKATLAGDASKWVTRGISATAADFPQETWAPRPVLLRIPGAASELLEVVTMYGLISA
jgi:hypothetical protein